MTFPTRIWLIAHGNTGLSHENRPSTSQLSTVNCNCPKPRSHLLQFDHWTAATKWEGSRSHPTPDAVRSPGRIFAAAAGRSRLQRISRLPPTAANHSRLSTVDCDCRLRLLTVKARHQLSTVECNCRLSRPTVDIFLDCRLSTATVDCRDRLSRISSVKCQLSTVRDSRLQSRDKE